MSSPVNKEKIESVFNNDLSSTSGQIPVGSNAKFDEALGMTKDIKDYIVDTEKEDGERMYDELKAKAEELNNNDGCPNNSQPSQRVNDNYPLTGRTG